MRDFVWWSGLTMADTKRGLEVNRATSRIVDGRTYWTVGKESRPGRPATDAHLLPIYDEYLVSYRDREAVPHGPSVVKAGARSSVTFQHALVIAGQVAGSWRMRKALDGTNIDVFPLRRLTKPERDQVKRAAERYSRFVGEPVVASVAN
jgi:hypothetical protein